MSIDLDLLPEVDLHGAAYLNDPFGVLAPLRAQSPLARSRRGIEVLRYDWIAELYADRRFITPDMDAFRAKGVPPRFDEFLENG
ncbi:MAG: hypothetical protein IT181_11005, partial [Acidobacteria bacterium]|nr:hypothetical protein [Acidobacteriota bacterium]